MKIVVLLGPPLLCLLLFINKPFHIDDTLFLTAADLMPWTFLGEAGGEANFLGEHYPHLNPYESTHPLLIPWFLKILDGFQGQGRPSFWIFHLGFLIFPALLLFSVWQLVRSFSDDPKWLWLLAASPVFFVNSTNLMTDLAMTAFWCATLAGTVAMVASRRRRDGFKAVFFFVAALLTSYQSVALFPLIFMYLLVHRALSWRTLWVLFIPLAILLSYLLAAYAVSGFFPFLASSIDINIASEVNSGLSGAKFGHKTLATFDFLGLGLAWLTPLLLCLSAREKRWRWSMVFLIWLGLVLLGGMATTVLDGYSTGAKVMVSLLIGLGSFWTGWVLWQAWQGLRAIRHAPNRAGVLLLGSCLFLGVTFYNIVLLPYGTARYVLPALPGALILLVFHWRGSLTTKLSAPLLCGSLAISLLMGLVDYRQASADLIIFREAKAISAPGQIIRFSDDAGLVRYFKGQNGRYITRETKTIPPEQLLLVTRGLIDPELQKTVRLIREIKVPTRWGLTLFDTQSRAGFYRSLDGLLPMAWAPLARRAFLYRVIWFENNLQQSHPIQLSNPNYFRRAAAEFPGRGTRHGLLMHPDATIAYPWPHQRPLIVSGNACPLPAAWEKEGDGVRCAVGITINGEQRELWWAEINAKQRKSDRNGVTFRVVVPAEAEAFWFKTGPGPKGDYRHDSMLWYDLAIEPWVEDHPVSAPKSDGAESR